MFNEKFKNMKIRGKITISHMIIAIIPVLIVGIIGLSIALDEAESNINTRINLMISEALSLIDTSLGHVESTINMTANVISKGNANSGMDEEEMSQYFDSLRDVYPEVKGIIFATPEDTYVSSSINKMSRDPLYKEDWYNLAIQNPQNFHALSDTSGRNINSDFSYSVDSVFSMVKAVVSPLSGEVYGVLLMDISDDIFMESLQRYVDDTNGFVYILDDIDQMVYAPVNDIVYRIDSDAIAQENVQSLLSIKGDSYVINSQSSTYSGWKAVSVLSYDETTSAVRAMVYSFTLILIISLIFVLVVSFRVSKSITKPIFLLRNLMSHDKIGHESIRYRWEYADEISDLGRIYNDMLDRIDRLIEEVCKEQELKRNAQLKTIQEQFKPHFLYNTLDAIGWKAREHSAHDIVAIVDALTILFRTSLSRGRDYIPLSQEINYIRNYMYIQKIRYGNKVNYIIEENTELSDFIVPKMILQPLVENAIYHGVKQKRGDGNISISTECTDINVILKVVDDGRGMPPDKAGKLESELNAPGLPGDSFGLFFVKECLRMYYGNMFKITVSSEENAGTTVCIEIERNNEYEYQHEENN